MKYVFLMALFINLMIKAVPELTIILPVYGLDKQVVPCIASIIADPMFGSYELLIMHIGSSEETYRDIQPFISHYSNISYVPLVHATLLEATNIGVSLAQAPYLTRIFTCMRMRQYGFDLMLDPAKDYRYRLVFGQCLFLEECIDSFYDIFNKSLSKKLIPNYNPITEYSPILWEKALHTDFGFLSDISYLSFFDLALKNHVQTKYLDRVIFSVAGTEDFSFKPKERRTHHNNKRRAKKRKR
jgi:hypothetical protein